MTNALEQAESSPFMRFWRAVNEQRTMYGKPELLYGEIQMLWKKALE